MMASERGSGAAKQLRDSEVCGRSWRQSGETIVTKAAAAGHAGGLTAAPADGGALRGRYVFPAAIAAPLREARCECNLRVRTGAVAKVDCDVTAGLANRQRIR